MNQLTPRRVRFADQCSASPTVVQSTASTPRVSALRKRKAECAAPRDEESASQTAAARGASSPETLDLQAARAIEKERLVRALEAAVASDPTAGARLRRTQGARVQVLLVRKLMRTRELSSEAPTARISSASPSASPCSDAHSVVTPTFDQPSASASV